MVWYKFTNRNYWYTGEEYETTQINPLVPNSVRSFYGVSSNSSGPIKATNPAFENYYWVGVGPKVMYSDYPDNGNPGQDYDENNNPIFPMYG